MNAHQECENEKRKHIMRYSPLHCAVWAASPEVCALLLENGAAVDAVDVYGQTPLHYLGECITSSGNPQKV